jgi:hypothetical protein
MGNTILGEEVRIFVDYSCDNFSQYQLGAIKAGISPYSFVIFDPTEYALELGYNPV